MPSNLSSKAPFSYAVAATWIGALLISIGFSVHFGLELVSFGRGERTIQPFTGELKIALIDWVGYHPLVVADRKGFLERRLSDTDVRVELYRAEDTGEMNDLIRTGKVQGSFGVLADFVVLKSLAIPIRIVMASDFSKSDVIVAKREIRSKSDIKGKTIGIGELGSFAEYFTIRSLERAGIDPHSVSFRTVSARNVPEAIEAGQIDAGYTWEPAKSRAMAKGMNVVFSSAESPEMVISSLAFRDEVLLDPRIAAAVILAYYDGLALYSKNPNEYGDIVAKYFGTQPQEVLRIMKEDSLFIDLKSNIKLFKPNETLQNEMRLINQFFSERGIRQTNESVLSLLDFAPQLEAERVGQSDNK